MSNEQKSKERQQRYADAITGVTQWFKEQFKLYGEGLPVIEIPLSELNKRGVDALEEPYKSMTSYAFQLWLYAKKYELSFNQIYQAFFAAAHEAKKLPSAKQ